MAKDIFDVVLVTVKDYIPTETFKYVRRANSANPESLSEVSQELHWAIGKKHYMVHFHISDVDKDIFDINPLFFWGYKVEGEEDILNNRDILIRFFMFDLEARRYTILSINREYFKSLLLEAEAGTGDKSPSNDSLYGQQGKIEAFSIYEDEGGNLLPYRNALDITGDTHLWMEDAEAIKNPKEIFDEFFFYMVGAMAEWKRRAATES